MNDIDLSLVPPLPPGLDLEDAWYCFEYRVNNEDFISPWLGHEMDIFEHLENVDEYLLMKKFIRTSEGIFEDDGLGDYHNLPLTDMDELYVKTQNKSLEDLDEL